MLNSQLIQHSKNFWADESEFNEEECFSCGECDCSIVSTLDEDGTWQSRLVEHDYTITITKDGEWEASCGFSALNDAEKIFWSHLAGLYTSIPGWMLESYKDIDLDDATDAVLEEKEYFDDYLDYDDDDDDYELDYDEDDVIDYDDDDDDDGYEVDEVDRSGIKWELRDAFQPTTSLHEVDAPLVGFDGKPATAPNSEEVYISPFTGRQV